MKTRFARAATSRLALLATLLLSNAASAVPPAPFVSPAQWMSALGQQVLAPRYAELARSAATLAERIEVSCRAPDDATLESARGVWRQTALELRVLSALPLGPALETRILRRLDFWPTRPAQIESSLRGKADGTLPEARIGVTAKGLPALEYLLFDPDRVRLDADPAACAYATWLAREIASELDAIQPAWSAWIDNLNEADAATEAQLLGDGVNILIGGLDTLRQKYLEKPARKPADKSAFDAWRSAQERAHLLAFFNGLRLGLQGADVPNNDEQNNQDLNKHALNDTARLEGKAMPGLSAIMRGRGLLELAARLDTQTAAVSAALQALPSSPAADGGAAIARATEALAALQGLLAREAADRLKVAVGFGENDGD